MQKEWLFLSLASIVSFSGLFGSPKNQDVSMVPPLDYYDREHNYAFGYGDWLFWKPVTSDPFTFAYRGDIYLPDQPPKGSAEYRLITANYDFSSGYRLGGGYRSPERTVQTHPITPWQFEFAFTQIVNRASNHISGLPGRDGNHAGQYIAPLFGNDQNGYVAGSYLSLQTAYESLDSVIDLKQSRLDAFFSWPIWIEKNLILRLSGGSTFVWFKNEWQISGKDGIAGFRPLNSWSLDWDYTGGGIFGGGDVQIPFGYGLGLYANASAALTYGRVTEKENYMNITFSDQRASITDHYQFAAFQPVVSFGTGINFERWINQKVLVDLGLGWEWHWWANMNRFSNPFNPMYQGNLDEVDAESAYYSLFQNAATDIIYQGMVLRAGFQY